MHTALEDTEYTPCLEKCLSIFVSHFAQY